MNIAFMGIDLAKNVFQLCGLTQAGKAVYTRYVKPFICWQKNDVNDAQAIAVALRQLTLQFVPQKPRTAGYTGVTSGPATNS